MVPIKLSNIGDDSQVTYNWNGKAYNAKDLREKLLEKERQNAAKSGKLGKNSAKVNTKKVYRNANQEGGAETLPEAIGEDL